MAMGARIIQADKKARDGMWLVLSISTNSLTIRILLAYTYDSIKMNHIVPKNSHSSICIIFHLYAVLFLLYNYYVYL